MTKRSSDATMCDFSGATMRQCTELRRRFGLGSMSQMCAPSAVAELFPHPAKMECALQRGEGSVAVFVRDLDLFELLMKEVPPVRGGRCSLPGGLCRTSGPWVFLSPAKS